MVIITAVAATPVLIWLWLGVTFTIIDYILHQIYIHTGVTAMDIINSLREVADTETREELDRIVRYTDIIDDEYPGTLSIYNPDKNLILIDRKLSGQLSVIDRNYLEMSYIRRTRLSGSLSTLGYVEYSLVTEKPVTQQVTSN